MTDYISDAPSMRPAQPGTLNTTQIQTSIATEASTTDAIVNYTDASRRSQLDVYRSANMNPVDIFHACLNRLDFDTLVDLVRSGFSATFDDLTQLTPIQFGMVQELAAVMQGGISLTPYEKERLYLEHYDPYRELTIDDWQSPKHDSNFVRIKQRMGTSRRKRIRPKNMN